MSRPKTELRVYRLSPWRRAIVALGLTPLFLAIGVAVGVAMGARGRGMALVLAGALVVFLVAYRWAVGRVRLELSPEGVRSVGFGGMTLEAAWADVVGIRLDRGREGLITGKPLAGRYAEGLATHRGLATTGAPWYDDAQRALMAERRLIPLDAYATYLRRGDLLAEIARFAPHLATACAAGPPA